MAARRRGKGHFDQLRSEPGAMDQPAWIAAGCGLSFPFEEEVMSPLPKRPRKFTGFKKPAPRNSNERTSLTGQAGAAAAKPTLWPALDATEIAFRPGELSLIVGRSAHGKSNFLLNLLHNWLGPL